ncbi:unnamed protein product, partial [Brachionus calyciflorus]
MRFLVILMLTLIKLTICKEKLFV